MTDPHENFYDIMNSLIGQYAEGRESYQYGYLRHATGAMVLQNGNTEYFMDNTLKRDKEQCAYALEVDKKTRRFVGWRYMSDPRACYANP